MAERLAWKMADLWGDQLVAKTDVRSAASKGDCSAERLVWNLAVDWAEKTGKPWRDVRRAEKTAVLKVYSTVASMVCQRAAQKAAKSVA